MDTKSMSGTYSGAKFKRKTMHDRIANTLIVTGAVLVALGAGVIYVAAGLIVAGVFCIGGGYLLALNGSKQ